MLGATTTRAKLKLPLIGVGEFDQDVYVMEPDRELTAADVHQLVRVTGILRATHPLVWQLSAGLLTTGMAHLPSSEREHHC